MADRLIDESELNALNVVHGRVKQLLAHPEARKLFLKGVKTVDPNFAIPELDAAVPVEAAVSDVRGEIAALRADLAERDRKAVEDAQIRAFQNKWADQEASLRGQGWRTEGIAAVRNFAEENGIHDLSIAADAWEKRNPAPDLAPAGNGMWGIFGDAAGGPADDTFIADMMKSGGNDDRRLDQEIRAAIADTRSAR